MADQNIMTNKIHHHFLLLIYQQLNQDSFLDLIVVDFEMMELIGQLLSLNDGLEYHYMGGVGATGEIRRTVQKTQKDAQKTPQRTGQISQTSQTPQPTSQTPLPTFQMKKT